MVGAEGFEPPTLCSQSRCATRLRYAPTISFDCNPNFVSSPGPRPYAGSRVPSSCPDALQPVLNGVKMESRDLNSEAHENAVLARENAVLQFPTMLRPALGNPHRCYNR